MKKQQRLETLLKGCPRCYYEEDDGGLHRHCVPCQYEITKLTYEIVIDDRQPIAEELVGFANGLTQAQEEMFQLCEEECAELIKAISKIRRHGENSTLVDGDPTLNRRNLTEEAGDVIACIALLGYNGLLNISLVNDGARMKLNRIRDPSTKRVHFITPEMVP